MYIVESAPSAWRFVETRIGSHSKIKGKSEWCLGRQILLHYAPPENVFYVNCVPSFLLRFTNCVHLSFFQHVLYQNFDANSCICRILSRTGLISNDTESSVTTSLRILKLVYFCPLSRYIFPSFYCS